MKQTIPLLLATVLLFGCSKHDPSPQTINTKWDINVTPLENETCELTAAFEKLTDAAAGNWHNIKLNQMHLPPLILKPNLPAEDKDIDPENSRTMHSKGFLDASGEKVTFELRVVDGGITYLTNGVITLK